MDLGDPSTHSPECHQKRESDLYEDEDVENGEIEFEMNLELLELL